jgi:hypothetical protein
VSVVRVVEGPSKLVKDYCLQGWMVKWVWGFTFLTDILSVCLDPIATDTRSGGEGNVLGLAVVPAQLSRTDVALGDDFKTTLLP